MLEVPTLLPQNSFPAIAENCKDELGYPVSSMLIHEGRMLRASDRLYDGMTLYLEPGLFHEEAHKETATSVSPRRYRTEIHRELHKKWFGQMLDHKVSQAGRRKQGWEALEEHCRAKDGRRQALTCDHPHLRYQQNQQNPLKRKRPG